MGAEDRTRRAAESFLAAIALIAALPLILAAAAASALCYRAWPFFVHDRVGLGGMTFRLVKIRSLPPTANRYTDKYSLASVRIPKPMALMRKTHLDELPQLWHVVRGHMAFVGPRPEMPTLHGQLPASFASQRVSVLPGLTCLWQISPHSAGLIGERTEYDRLYVEYRTILFDLWILLRTAVKMTAGKTVRLHEVPSWVISVSSAPPHVGVPVGRRPHPVRSAREPVLAHSGAINLVD